MTGVLSATPAAIGDGWGLSTLRDERIDSTRLDSLAQRIQSGRFGRVDALVIARNGRLCYDAYFSGGPTTVHELQSVTKSVTSALVGAAVARGAIASMQQPVAALLPDFAAAVTSDPAKAAIRVVDLLTMSSGLDWDEQSLPNTDARNTLTQMNNSADWTGFVLSRRAVEAPGTRFVYNSGGVILLGALLRASTGQDVVAFATDALFSPLGIRDQAWYRNPRQPDQVHTGGGLSLRARDMAKLGQLYLDDGMWAGQQVLPRDWVRESTRTWLAAPSHGRLYGFLWWLRSTPGAGDVPEAWGARGQHIFVVRPMNLVVVVTASDDRNDSGTQILDEVVASVI
jgi:CubicO group peptidase (beta-lactamase class C family)